MSEVCLHAFTLRQMVKKSVNEGMRKSVDISADFDVPFTLVNRGLRKNGKKKDAVYACKPACLLAFMSTLASTLKTSLRS